jgi:cytochrome P450
VTRRLSVRLGFGHGAYACVGRQIARTELTTVLRAPARRVPALRIAVPLEEIVRKKDSLVRGLVAWS